MQEARTEEVELNSFSTESTDDTTESEVDIADLVSK